MSERRAAVRSELRVLTPESPRPLVEELAGGKGRGLFELTALGVPVPRWSILGVDVLRRFGAGAGLDLRVEEEVADLGEDPTEEILVAAASRIRAAIVEAAPDAEIEAVLADAYARAGGGAVAVRSSAVGEDGGHLSFAGQHTTHLNVVGSDALIAAVRSCWASAWSAEALRYRLINGLSLQGIEMAVVVQAIVAAEVSGVLFTVNPAGNEEELVISASYGLGEAVVSGAVDADTVVLDRITGTVRRRTIGAKEKRIDPLPQGGCREHPVPESQRSAAAISDLETARLHREGMRLEQLIGSPQDIEWALAAGRLWILQSRPITGVPTAAGELRLWDNSNIIESYGEIVAPLTYSFAGYVYHRVYREYCELLGVPARQLEQMDGWLPYMLGYFDGRVYYNLLNWYRVIRLIPFYSINRRVLEISIGAEPLEEGLAARQQPLDFRNGAEAIVVRTAIAVRFAWYFATLHRLVGDFVDHFYRVYDEFESVDYGERRADELYSMFKDMERRLLVRWGRMIVLEASIGLAFGALHLLTQRWLPAAPDWLLYEAVKTSPDLESMQPLRRLDEIAAAIVADDELHGRVSGLPSDRLETVLRGSDRRVDLGVVARIDAYLEEFGDRNANELKLEEPDLREDPAVFFALLKSAVGRLEEERTTAAGGPDVDAYISERLRGWRRRAYEVVRGRVQRSLADRERVRFCRTRIFGLSRRMFRAIGEELAREGALAEPGDIFYLRLEELRGAFEGTIAHRELRPLVDLRKDQERRNRRHELPPRFTTRGGVYWDALDQARAAASPDVTPDDGGLRGTPCSPGLVRGEAQVIERPVDVGGRVLVTYRTDPGWVGVLRSASALLIERGSPLTHVAVVARELRIPTIVQIPGLTRRVRSGMRLTVDGGTGVIELSEGEGEDDGN
jgi:phosphohistidine swiveling domain-containing protein